MTNTLNKILNMTKPPICSRRLPSFFSSSSPLPTPIRASLPRNPNPNASTSGAAAAAAAAAVRGIRGGGAAEGEGSCAAVATTDTMSAAVCGKRASSFFEELPHAAASPPPSKRARFRGGGGSPSPPRLRRAADPALVAAIRARFPSVSLEFIEKALEECENDLDSAMKCLLNLHLEPTEYIADLVYQSPKGMSTDVQVPDEGASDGNEVAASIESVPGGDNLPSGSSQWVEILVNEMASASNMDDAKARASRVMEVFEKSMISHIGVEAMQNFQKENLVYKEQFEAVVRENTILKKAVAIQHERQKEHDERNQEFQQLKQLVAQYQEQIRSLEVNNYALSIHLRQAQQGISIPGHFHRDIF